MKFRVIVIASQAIATQVNRLFDLVRDLGIANFVTIPVADADAARDLIAIRGGDVSAVFVDGELPVGMGVIRATGFRGHIALLGGPDVAHDDMEFYDLVCHGSSVSGVTNAVCLLLKDLSLVPSDEAADDRTETELTEDDLVEAWEMVASSVRGAIASV
jgi:hypothetical protein